MSLRIWIITSAFYPAMGGAENQALEVGAELVRRGVDVHVLTRAWPDCGPDDEVRGVRIHRRGPAYALPGDIITASRRDSVRAALAWCAELWARRHAIDLLHANNIYSQATVGAYFHRWRGWPLAVKVPGARTASELDGRRGRYLARHVGAWFVPNPDVAHDLRDRGMLPSKRVLFLPNGVRSFPLPLRPAPEPRVLFTGRLVALKRVDVLLESWARVLRAHPRARLDIVGYGVARAGWETQARTLGIDETIRFHGGLPQEQAWALLSQAHAFVQCSESEGISNALLEAASAGVPTVVTDISGNRVVIPDGGHGVLVPVGDARALGDALANTLSRPEEAQRRTARAKERVERLLGLSGIAERYLEVYRRLAWAALPRRRGGARRLAVVSAKMHWRDGPTYLTDGGFPRQVATLAELFDETTLYVPVGRRGTGGTNVTGLGLHVRALPAPSGDRGLVAKLRLLHKLAGALPVLHDAVRRATALHVRLPSYEGLLALALARLGRRPALVWLGGNWQERVLLTADTPLRRVVSRILPRLIGRLVRGQLVYVMGDQFRGGLPEAGAIYHDIATSIRVSDLVDPTSRPWPRHPERVSLIYVGRLSEEKGLPYLLEALSRWPSTAPTPELTIVGDGPLGRDLAERAVAKRLPVHFRGRRARAEVDLLLDHADIFVLPSLADASPKVIIEAMAHGLPVVATRVGGVPRLLGDGERGELVSPGNATTLLEGLLRVLEDSDLRHTRLDAAHAWVRTQTLEAQRERFRKALHERFGPAVMSMPNQPARAMTEVPRP